MPWLGELETAPVGVPRPCCAQRTAHCALPLRVGRQIRKTLRADLAPKRRRRAYVRCRREHGTKNEALPQPHDQFGGAQAARYRQAGERRRSARQPALPSPARRRTVSLCATTPTWRTATPSSLAPKQMRYEKSRPMTADRSPGRVDLNSAEHSLAGANYRELQKEYEQQRAIVHAIGASSPDFTWKQICKRPASKKNASSVNASSPRSPMTFAIHFRPPRWVPNCSPGTHMIPRHRCSKLRRFKARCDSIRRCTAKPRPFQ